MDWLKKKTKEVTSKVAKIQKDQKAEAAAKRGVPPPKKRPANVDSSVTRPDNAFEDDSSTSEAFEQAKAFEKLRIAEAGYNPYARPSVHHLPPPLPSRVLKCVCPRYEPTISSSTAARSAAVITAQTSPSRPTSRDVPSPSKQRPSSLSLPPATAATMRKILQNILDHPEDDKFHKLRLSNGAIQAKIACVPEALAFLHEIGFDAVVLDDHEEYLVLNATRTSTDTLAAAVARLQNGTST
ncbi:hypothetical protein DYB31_007168 [Aphanomyces astaci]|uniref:PUB domain-containing protein n=1 Tax=Aphanomyces astaci TaxID=112090 RepID=A0A397FA95_APHAT|nr:hypothetical protein DYB31_007168 [Aphanomyces astaci]